MGEGINGIAAKVGQDVSHDPDGGIVGGTLCCQQ